MSIDELTPTLDRVRTRARAARVIRVLPWAVVVGTVGFAIAGIGGVSFRISAALALSLAIGGIVVGVVAWSIHRPLTRDRVARLIDSRLQMNEMASTAVEFVPGSSVLAFALHEQAGRRLRLVEPAEVVSFRWTKASTWATVLAASVLVAPLLGFRPDTRGPAVSPERAVSIDSVLSLAEVARAAAAVQRDPHMEAISKALEELAASAEAAGATAVEDLNTLEELVAALGRLASPTMTGRERSEGGDGGQNDLVDMESAIAGLEETLGRVAGLTGLNEDLLVFAEDSMSEVSTAGDGATLSGSPDSSSSMPSGVAKSDSALSASSLSELGAEGDLESAYRIGASSQASAGASLLAGEGTQDLFGESTFGAPATSFEAVNVEGIDIDNGRQVSVEISPNVAESRGSDARPWEVTGSAWEPARLPNIGGVDLPMDYRSVAGSYFLPPQETR